MDKKPSSHKYCLEDLIDLRELQVLAEKLYQAAGFSMGLIDENGNILIAVGWQKICTDFHRANKESCQSCIKSDLKIYQNLQNLSRDGYFAYQCENGLWDIAIPIKIQDQYLGACYLGQFFYQDDIIDEQEFKKRATKYNYNETEYLAALHQVPIYAKDQVKKIIDYYVQLVHLVTIMGLKNLAIKEETEQRVRAEESDKAKSMFLASMSHEIRTPMNSVLGMSELMLETNLTEQQKSYMHTLQFAGQTLLDLINTVCN